MYQRRGTEMAATFISVETGLQILSQLLTLLQNSNSTGQPIDPAVWASVQAGRDASVNKLDTDIAAAKAAGSKLDSDIAAAKAAGK